jgi:hypothetical protein
MTDDLAKLAERLRAEKFSGRFAMGGGSIGTDGSGKTTSTSWGGERIMELSNPDGPESADAIEALLGEKARLGAALGATIGNMMNAQFDLEGGATKAFAIKQIGKAIANARAALTACSDQPETTSGGE